MSPRGTNQKKSLIQVRKTTVHKINQSVKSKTIERLAAKVTFSYFPPSLMLFTSYCNHKKSNTSFLNKGGIHLTKLNECRPEAN